MKEFHDGIKSFPGVKIYNLHFVDYYAPSYSFFSHLCCIPPLPGPLNQCWVWILHRCLLWRDLGLIYQISWSVPLKRVPTPELLSPEGRGEVRLHLMVSNWWFSKNFWGVYPSTGGENLLTRFFYILRNTESFLRFDQLYRQHIRVDD